MDVIASTLQARFPGLPVAVGVGLGPHLEGAAPVIRAHILAHPEADHYSVSWPCKTEGHRYSIGLPVLRGDTEQLHAAAANMAYEEGGEQA